MARAIFISCVVIAFALAIWRVGPNQSQESRATQASESRASGAGALSKPDKSALPIEVVAQLKHQLLPEASGIAVSGLDPKQLWLINDSGNRSELVAVDLGSDESRRVNVLNTPNRDWEDMESFTYEGASWIVIADVGDNQARRDKVMLYFLPEPDKNARRVAIATAVTVSYPDGPRDVESMAVDPVTKTLYLLSKRDRFPKLYALELPALGEHQEYEEVLKLVGEVRSIPAPTADEIAAFPPYGASRNQPTSMAHIPNGSGIALLTYGQSYVAALDDDRDWLRALNESLCPVPRPELKQAESITADEEGRLYITSEGKQAPVLRLIPDLECGHGES